ncbi:MAG: aminotransferase class III-fold pyridoxal phosphate-dependent enzyme, partial [Bacteroidetes bacterium]|nr:aminotransferase class III-fold pyridoxal phosphate-dependent enzyme [Bacteroidota bacterium]
KAMGGGMPMGAFVSSSEIFSVFKKDPPLNHVTTFGGHPVSCAAAYANLKTLLEGDFQSKARDIEKMSRHVLRGDGIEEVRGRGAMLGLQLRDRELTQNVVKDLFEKGIILGWTLHSDTLVRIAPPLIIERDLLNETLNEIRDSVRTFA